MWVRRGLTCKTHEWHLNQSWSLLQQWCWPEKEAQNCLKLRLNGTPSLGPLSQVPTSALSWSLTTSQLGFRPHPTCRLCSPEGSRVKLGLSHRNFKVFIPCSRTDLVSLLIRVFHVSYPMTVALCWKSEIWLYFLYDSSFLMSYLISNFGCFNSYRRLGAPCPMVLVYLHFDLPTQSPIELTLVPDRVVTW